MYLIAEFREKDAVAEAIRLLRSRGASDADLDVFSEEPVEFRRGVLDRPSRMSLVAVVAAAVFGSLATGFIYWAQYNYRLATGGMPVFSFWATGVITYEMTMFGAILGTFGWFLWESGLIRRRDRSAPVPEVDPGMICLRVRCQADAAADASNAVRGAEQSRWSGEARHEETHRHNRTGGGSHRHRAACRASLGEGQLEDRPRALSGQLRSLPRYRFRRVEKDGSQFLQAFRTAENAAEQHETRPRLYQNPRKVRRGHHAGISEAAFGPRDR